MSSPARKVEPRKLPFSFLKPSISSDVILFYNAAANFLTDYLLERLSQHAPISSTTIGHNIEDGNLTLVSEICLESNNARFNPIKIYDVAEYLGNVATEEELKDTGVATDFDSEDDRLFILLTFGSVDEVMKFVDVLAKPYDFERKIFMRAGWESAMKGNDMFFNQSLYSLHHIRALYETTRKSPFSVTSGLHLTH